MRAALARTVRLVILVAPCLILGCEPRPSIQPAIMSPVPTLSSAELSAAVEFRATFGLRSDRAWVLQVAADPGSDRTSFATPLTTEEAAELMARSASIEAIKAQVHAYAEAHPDEWAGGYADQARGDIYVAQFTGHLVEHRAALFSKLRPGSALEVRQVRWTLSQLDEFSLHVPREQSWYEQFPAALRGFGPNLVENVVAIRVSSADPSIEQRILGRLGWDRTIAHVDFDGTGVALLPLGTLVIHAVDSAGNPVHGLDCIPVADLDGAYIQEVVPATNDQGICTMTLPATGYWYRLETPGPPRAILAVHRIVVVANETVEATFVIP